MNTASASSRSGRDTTVVRLGGLAGLMAVGLHLLINFVLITGAPQPGGSNVLTTVGANEIGHGLRYPAFFCLAIFAVGMYVLTDRGEKTLSGNPWGILGLLGAAAQITTGVIANTIRAMALISSADVSGQPEYVTLLWRLGGVLFTAEPMWAGMMFIGFGIAGWQSETLPKWLAVIGLLCAALNLIVDVFIVWVMTGQPAAELLRWIRTILGLIWFSSASLLMVLPGFHRGARGA